MKKNTTVYLFTATALCAAAVFLSIGPYIYERVQYTLSTPTPAEDFPSHASVVIPAETLYIPSLGIQAPVVQATAESEVAYQQALRSGVVQYPGSAGPGQLGNMYIFGHSSDYLWSKGNFKTVFALLPKISIGDHVLVSDQTGKVFTYAVKDTFVVAPTERWVLSSYGPEERLLTLQTSYPIGTALKRFIVRAELVKN